MASMRREPEREALHDAVRAAVEQALTPRQREIVEAHFFEGLSQGDIAQRLGVAQQVVQKALFGDLRRGQRVGGAIARLRKALSPLVAKPSDPSPPRAPRPSRHHGN
jgi:DNA-directed RNA polymerase specialized sigma24 family protein